MFQMRVKRLTLQSFRGIRDLTLQFDPTEPTVLIGSNGVGKSSIIECLAILLSRFTCPVQHPTTSGRLFSQEDISYRQSHTGNAITLDTPAGEVTWSLVRGKSERSTGSDLSALRGLIEQTQQALSNHPLHSLPVIVYYAVNRAVLHIPLRLRSKLSFRQVDAYEQALMGKQIDFRLFFEWFRKQEDLENEIVRDDPTHRDRSLEAVRRAIQSLQLGFTHLRVRRSPSLRLTVLKNGHELMVNQLSDGEKCLLAMVGDLARRLAIANPAFSDPLQGVGIVLIDEIELHLHPKWQRELIPTLMQAFPNCQFVVSTHSPQVISNVQPEGVYLLQCTDAGIVVDRPENSFGRDSNRILEDLMQVPERPQAIKDALRDLFRLIDAGDLAGASQLRQQLASEIGDDEPEFVRADVLIRRKEILNR
jgi:predicted ATP-binding protein involved in virulence